jgi:hypothetical protein
MAQKRLELLRSKHLFFAYTLTNATDLDGQHLLKDDTEVYKQFVQNESFHRFVTDMIFDLTNE